MSTQTVGTEVILHDLGNKVESLVFEADQLVITNQPSYNDACQFLKALVERRKEIADTFGPIKTKQYAAWKETVAQEKRFLDPTETAERKVKGKLAVWEQEQEGIRQEEQRRLEAEARQREEDERLQAAVAAEKDGASAEEVEAILEEQAPVPVQVARPTFQRAAGISKPRENWRGECVSLLDLVCHITGTAKVKFAHPELLPLLQANQVAINQTARAQKELCKVPGIRVYNDPNIAVR